MTPEHYRVIHVVGILMLFLGLGGMFASAGREGGKAPFLFSMFHGLGLLVMIVAGIGAAHAGHLGWPMWMIAKMGCWLLLAVLPILVRRGKLGGAPASLLALVLGGVAVWLVTFRPF